MTPSEFYNLYGPCITRVVSITAGVLRKIPADPNRYLLAFWRATANLVVMPDGGDLLLTFGTPFAANGPPLIFTHTEHGSLPSMGWQLGPDGWIGTNDVLVVMGVAGRQPRRVNNAADQKR